jgi:hypothetical protein
MRAESLTRFLQSRDRPRTTPRPRGACASVGHYGCTASSAAKSHCKTRACWLCAGEYCSGSRLASAEEEEPSLCPWRGASQYRRLPVRWSAKPQRTAAAGLAGDPRGQSRPQLVDLADEPAPRPEATARCRARLKSQSSFRREAAGIFSRRRRFPRLLVRKPWTRRSSS